MANTMHAYLKEYGDVPFTERPMNDVDSLVLCQLAYLKFDGLVPGIDTNAPSVTLKELAKHPMADGLFADERFEKDNRELFARMLAGRRFCNLKLNCYINIVEKEWETQFAAITCILEDNTIYVAFRGTDETIVGWKEDFNMAYLSPVPGQAMSVKYLNMVTEKFGNLFYVGGHSKGGNFAVYSAMKCVPKVQERILKVYCMDGPGFRPEVLEECGYDKIADRVVKLLPHSSLVGMLFEWDTRYRVVESGSFGLAQHNPYNWKVKNGEFVMAEDIYERARLTDSTLNEWILSLDEGQIRLFVDTLYRVISASEADDLIAITADWKRSMMGVAAALKEVDEDTMKMLQQVIRDLFELARVRMREELGIPVRKASGLAKSARRGKRRTEAVPPTA
ncbi:MAG: DUF2974 domain-containing protein [Muribaculum sp.]|nr:DUF2974 domain-containing protein [Muribaculum sp.]